MQARPHPRRAELSASPTSGGHCDRTAPADVSAGSQAEATLAEPLHTVARFADLLRQHGFTVGVAEQQALVQAACLLPPSQSQALRAAWRAVACHSARDWRQWDDVFDRFWHPQRVRGTVRVSGLARPTRDMRQLVQHLQQQLGAAGPQAAPDQPRPGLDTALDAPPPDAADADEAGAPRAQGGASRTEALHDKRFNEWLPQDLSRLQQLAERIAQRLRPRPTRRWHAAADGHRLDLRRTLRASLRTGGVPLHPAWVRTRTEPPRLFVLVDVSRSMETHAQLFLRIARAFVTARLHQGTGGGGFARVFIFHTRLAEVTPLLKSDSAAVQEKVNAVTAGFGGGTRIATALRDFVQTHARGQLRRGARVWVLSDGFDADPPDELAPALAAVRGRGARITWFHPSDEAPQSQAMQAVRRDDSVQRFVRLNRLSDLAEAGRYLN